ncbi:hypothetical protein EW146_g4641 [Bondarzewia mesenterica]|uniref:Uncharacterized protein n=1 Tax=Bondarzewia mesenterica TaxID=1095465 RepID=A0A4S4LV05_9AGAM|nr:hypothetical protein EW146_g4641 [Bondarzewia mesenterica]
MSTTQTISISPTASSLFLHNSDSKYPIKDVNVNVEDETLDGTPEELVDKALHRLQIAGVQLIEWGTLLFRRIGVPVMLTHYHYLIPDDELEVASDIASGMGLPLSPPAPILVKSSGDFFTKARLHRLTRSTPLGLVQYLILLPISFASYTSSELDLLPRITSLPSPTSRTLLVPQSTTVYASILRAMAAYPRWSPTRQTLESNLSELIGYNLYDLQGGYVDIDDDDLCHLLEVDRRVKDAIQVVKGWGWAGKWRDGEEWMDDALVAVVAGTGEFEALPWAS